MAAVAGGSLPGPAARLAVAMKSWTCAGLLAAVGCGHGGGGATQCNLAAEPAVVVTLVGPTSGATLVLIDGSYQETMVEVEPGAFRGGFERAGTYRVEASAPGFVSQAVDGVVAAQLDCGPDTQTLTITLVPTTLPALFVVPDELGGHCLRAGRLQVVGAVPDGAR